MTWNSPLLPFSSPLFLSSSLPHSSPLTNFSTKDPTQCQQISSLSYPFSLSFSLLLLLASSVCPLESLLDDASCPELQITTEQKRRRKRRNVTEKERRREEEGHLFPQFQKEKGGQHSNRVDEVMRQNIAGTFLPLHFPSISLSALVPRDSTPSMSTTRSETKTSSSAVSPR